MNADRQTAVLYLHGFASGPSSTKATFFQSRLADILPKVLVPDLNGASFEHMTISSQLEIIRKEIARLDPGDDLLIIGSSMGGLLATLAAPGVEQVRALVLLAPGFDLPRRWTQLLGAEGVERWRLDGYTEVFHYGLDAPSRLSHEFMVDAEKYRTDKLKTAVPTLVFHGISDETVPAAESIEFAELNPDQVELHILDDGHELIEPLEDIWECTVTFLRKVGFIPATDTSSELTDQKHRVS